MRYQPSRPGFTLLEVLLASAIGVLLMAGLYVAVEVQLRHAQNARDVVEQSTLARSLLTRMASDVMPSIAPPMPVTTSSSSGSSGGSAQPATGGSTSGTTAATGATTGAATSTPAPTPTTPTTTGVPINVGVQGDTSRLIVSISRVPREWTSGQDNTDGQPFSDHRRITYWLVQDGDTPVGLARQEIKLVTSDEQTSAVPPDVPDEARYVIAEEVKSLAFSYFDGQTWVDAWDGTTPGADGMTPIGPPPAVAIVIGVLPAGKPNTPESLKYYRHVVAIPTANGTTQVTTTTTTP